ncbi:uncharacterized protein LOC129790947 [Lutzomyia longipalpis]|uniref:uncharacterized protein LOC129790947 n=1 Tax=Lutzomyia longipalpis TaxID=7200 RepID=UPI0024845BA0|nr:uncharacterized protein LOC129790947 [Lutzomyia longipalpis]
MEFVNKECQTIYRESSAQTKRWRPRRRQESRKRDESQGKREPNRNRIRLMEILETTYGPNNLPQSVQNLLHALELQLWTLKEFEMSLCQEQRLNYVKKEILSFQQDSREVLGEKLDRLLRDEIITIDKKRKSIELHVERELRKNRRNVVN